MNDMNEKLSQTLASDENIVWSGKVGPFETMDQTNGKPFTTRCIVHLVVAAALCIGYVLLAHGQDLRPAFFVLILFLAALGPVSDYLSVGRLRRGNYYVTNQRILSQMNDTVQSIPFEQIQQAALRRDEDGHTSLLIGSSAMKTKPSKWRTFAASGAIVDEGKCERYILYNISDPDGLRAAIAGKFPLEG